MLSANGVVKMPSVTLQHRTSYHYHNPVVLGDHHIMVRPLGSATMDIVRADLLIDHPATVRKTSDEFGNTVECVMFGPDAVAEVSIVSRFVIEHRPRSLVDIEAAWHGGVGATSEVSDMVELARMRSRPDPTGTVDEWARVVVSANCSADALEIMVAMNERIYGEFSYASRQVAGTQDPAQTVCLGTGSCRDFAMLLIEAARSLGFPARFVSGYLYNDEEQPDLVGGRSTHAWAQVFLSGAGWVDFDPTNALVGDRNLIPVGVTLDARQAVPVWGTYTGSAADFSGMDVDVAFACVPLREELAVVPYQHAGEPAYC